jgi:hypothetical protein
MASSAEVDAAAAVIFAHHQFKGDDYIARWIAQQVLEAAEDMRQDEKKSAKLADRNR